MCSGAAEDPVEVPGTVARPLVAWAEILGRCGPGREKTLGMGIAQNAAMTGGSTYPTVMGHRYAANVNMKSSMSFLKHPRGLALCKHRREFRLRTPSWDVTAEQVRD